MVEAPPAGLEPAVSGLRARRHRHFDHGGQSKAPAAGVEPTLSRVTVARLTDSTTPERRRRQQDSNLRTTLGRLRGSNALPFQLGHASTKAEGEGVEPQGPRAHPFSRRDTAPMA